MKTKGKNQTKNWFSQQEGYNRVEVNKTQSKKTIGKNRLGSLKR